MQRPRSYWCSRGGLYVVVKARTAGEARSLAHAAFARGVPRRRASEAPLRVRTASRSDLALWAELLDQQARLVQEAAPLPLSDPDPNQIAMFAE